jgi:hypothetical protein
MEEGFIVDHSRNRSNVASWVAGKLEYGVFGGAKVWDKEECPVQIFRCRNCGYLESYAPMR